MWRCARREKFEGQGGLGSVGAGQREGAGEASVGAAGAHGCMNVYARTCPMTSLQLKAKDMLGKAEIALTCMPAPTLPPAA